jgi:phospholipid/cholesterol/gamma-HCH transport system substrate-binding protein
VSRSLSAAQAFVLGALLLAAAGLAGGGLFAVGSRAWYGRDAFTVRAGFRDIRGVEVGTRVRVQGIDAGEVVAIEPPDKPGGDVLLLLKMRGEYRRLVNSTSTVQIVGEGMIGGKVVEVVPGPDGPGVGPVADNALLKTSSSAELGDLLDEANGLVKDARAGKGSLGKLVADPQLHDDIVALVREGRETMAAFRRSAASLEETSDSVRQIADSADRLPLVGGYIESPAALLVRANAQHEREVFAEADLFEPGRAVLTPEGKKKLDALKPWLDKTKATRGGSEVVVVCYADPAGAPPAARVLTRQRSEAVTEYLVKNLKAHSTGWFSSRKVTPLGMGTAPPPLPEPKPLPPGRVEVVVFMPENR